MAKTQKEYWEYLDELGEEEVRANFAQGIYGGHHLRYVNGWLKRQDQRRKERQEAFDANTLAKIAIIIAALAAVGALIAIFSD